MRGQHWVETLVVAAVVLFLFSYIYMSSNAFVRFLEQGYATAKGIEAANKQRMERDVRLAYMDVNFVDGDVELNVVAPEDNGSVLDAVVNAFQQFGYGVRP